MYQRREALDDMWMRHLGRSVTEVPSVALATTAL